MYNLKLGLTTVGLFFRTDDNTQHCQENCQGRAQKVKLHHKLCLQVVFNFVIKVRVMLGIHNQ